MRTEAYSFFVYIYILKILLERHQREWKKCLNSDSNRDPPAYAADCSAVELLRPWSDSRARGHLNHLASASALMTLQQFFQYISSSFNSIHIYIYIYIYKWKKIPEGQVYVPRLEPTAPIRLADRNYAH